MADEVKRYDIMPGPGEFDDMRMVEDAEGQYVQTEFIVEIRQNAADDRADGHESYARISDIYAKRLDEILAAGGS